MELKTKPMRKLLEPVQDQINNMVLLYKAPVNQSEVAAVRTVLLEQFHSLNERFKNIRSDDASEETDAKHNNIAATSKLTFLLQEISELIQIITSGNTHGRINDKLHINYDIISLVTNFTLALRTLEDLECLPLKQRLQDCLDYVRDMSLANEIEDFQNIKELGTSLLELFEPLQKYRKSLVSVFLSEKVALYTCQLCTSFEMLVKLAQEQHQLNAPIYASKKYICERICTCCELILDLLNGSNPSLEKETAERENHFVYRMDLALDILLEMPSKSHQEQQTECVELWMKLESVFSHAMAITQVCQSYNFNAITGSCQSIVMEYEKLKQQLLLETPDSALNNLFIHTLTDALYRLERKVNIAVLTLALEVFSNPYAALKKLVMMCGNSLNARRRSKNDLKTLIEDFDLLSDQTMQIGIFAIACCKDINRNNKIRTCLAGFESLETELISAITAFYLHPENKEMRSSVKLLTTQWQQEMNKFQNAVNLIINPAAFCEIVTDSLQERIREISDCLDNREPVTQSQVQGIVQRASALSGQVTAVVNDIDANSVDRQTIMMVRELKAAICEANIAAKTLLIDNATEPQQLRVIKRCELILNVVQRLQPALSAIMNNTTHEKTARFQGSSSHCFVSSVTNFPSAISGLPRDESSPVYIRTPYTVKAYKPQVSIQSANSIAQKPAALSDLIPYIQKGRTLRLEQSIMYSSPLKNKKPATEPAAKRELSRRNLASIRQHLFSRNSFTVQNDISVSEESMDLTAVLEKISRGSKLEDTTLSSYQSSKKHEDKCFEGTSKVPQAISNTVEKPSEIAKSETNSCLNKPSTLLKVGECAISGGGDASLVMEMTKKLNSIQLPNVRSSTLK